MGRPFRFFKLTLVLLVLTAAILRPVLVYAHNSSNNSISLASARQSQPHSCAFVRHVSLAKAMRVLDKEKMDVISQEPDVHKEWVFADTPFHPCIVILTVQPLLSQTTILRI